MGVKFGLSGRLGHLKALSYELAWEMGASQRPI